jgi:hypothetical protein
VSLAGKLFTAGGAMYQVHAPSGVFCITQSR